MSSLLGLFEETPAPARAARVTPIRERVRRPSFSKSSSMYDEQTRALVQRLFFMPEQKPVRHVGFTTVDGATETANLCLKIARTLAEEQRYDVALIDAHSDPKLLQAHLQIAHPNRAEAAWPIGQRLWMVPRESWLPEGSGRRIMEPNLSRLRETTREFDYSILWCAPMSWLTASISQACDGVVVVITASKTRRLVAAHVKEQLRQAQVPVLGTVLTERRFPVPRGLYQSL